MRKLSVRSVIAAAIAIAVLGCVSAETEGPLQDPEVIDLAPGDSVVIIPGDSADFRGPTGDAIATKKIPTSGLLIK
jgi:hypothetical protein